MVRQYVFLLLSALCLGSQSTVQLSEVDGKVIASVVKYLLTSRVTIVSENERPPISVVKVLNQAGIVVNFLTPAEAHLAVTTTTPNGVATIIVVWKADFECVFKTHNDTIPTTPEELKVRARRDWWHFIVMLESLDDPPPEELYIPFDQLVLTIGQQLDGSYLIVDQCNYEVTFTHHKRVRTAFGRWDLQRGFEPFHDCHPTFLYCESRRNIKNVTLTVQRLYRDLTLFPKTYTKLLTFSRDVVEAFHITFGFRIRFVSYGYSNDYDISEADVIALHADTQTAVVLKFALGPLTKWKINLYFKQIDESPLTNFALRPFETDVWLALIGWILLASSCLASARCLLTKARPLDSFFDVFSSFCGQGIDVENLAAIRLAGFSTWLTVSVVTASYSALIFTFIIIRQPYVPFNTVKEFADDGTYNYTGNKGSIQETLEEVLPEGSPQKTAARYQKEPFFVYSSTALEYVCRTAKHKIAILGLANHLEDERWPCNLIRMKEPYHEGWLAILTKMGTSYTNALKQGMPRLFTSGVLQHIEKQFSTISRAQNLAPTPHVDAKLIQPILLLLPFGLGFSIFILFIEIYIFNFQLLQKIKQKLVLGKCLTA